MHCATVSRVSLHLLIPQKSERNELSVTMVVRQKGDRRFNLPVEFPLVDSQGLFVIKDRRQLSERRKVKDDTDDLMVMLSEMADDLSI